MNMVIAQCTDEKRDGTHQAKDLYMPSDLFKAQRRYAEAYGDEWWILSGKYGLVRPWRRIESYDTHITEGWDENIQDSIDATVREWSEKSNPVIELICGHEDYANRLIPFLEYEGLRFREPFKGLGIGERTQTMIQEARKVENESIANYA